MVKTVIGGKSAGITKENDKIRIVFHPVRKEAKHPKASVSNKTIKIRPRRHQKGIVDTYFHF